jgi:F-type H+-transporting ATPase subunit a
VKELNLFEQHVWQPFAAMGLTSSWWSLNRDTIIYTWIALGIMLIVAYMGRLSIARPMTVPGYIAESYTRTFISMVTQTLEHFEYRYFAFIASLFTFIFICNVLVVLPFMEEPTKDLNTTLALALISFVFVQKEGIRAHGIGGYIKEFFRPFPIFFPLEVLGRLATIISLSFRLFGNIFGGSIITSLWHSAISGSAYTQILGTLLGINLIITLFFGIFEGLIQAFVFSILTLTYLSMSVGREDHE